MNCLSTHGGAGYGTGSYWDGYSIVCGGCGLRIDNPPPTGTKLTYTRKKGILGFLGVRDVKEEPSWPPFLDGVRGTSFSKEDKEKK
jgi:hypothetical protein